MAEAPTGAPWFLGDVGITDGRIAAMGRLDEANAAERIDARGLVVAPGFIDMLGQSEFNILVDGRAASKIMQGITTEVTGEGCASSKLLRPRNQGLTLRLNSGPKTAKLRRYAQRCCLPRLTWRPCYSGDVSAPRRPGVGERRFAAASDGAEERAPTPIARRHGTGFLGCPSRFVARVGRAACSSSTRTP